MTSPERYWTAEDVRALPEDCHRYECIDGHLLVTTPPSLIHQRACSRLVSPLLPISDAPSIGEPLFSPSDIELQTGTLVQPDVFVSRPRSGVRVRDWCDIIGLRLAVEVTSPATVRRDRGLKRLFYQRAGVEEYWIVDLDSRLVERWLPAYFAGMLGD